jgi:hypothetical protein
MHARPRGAPLARLEAAIALRQLLPLLPRLWVSGDPEWKPNTVLRGLEHLRLAQAPVSPPCARGTRRWRPGPSGPA